MDGSIGTTFPTSIWSVDTSSVATTVKASNVKHPKPRQVTPSRSYTMANDRNRLRNELRALLGQCVENPTEQEVALVLSVYRIAIPDDDEDQARLLLSLTPRLSPYADNIVAALRDLLARLNAEQQVNVAQRMNVGHFILAANDGNSDTPESSLTGSLGNWPSAAMQLTGQPANQDGAAAIGGDKQFCSTG